jgi:hypothetical protein
MFRNCKWVVVVEKLELGSSSGKGGKCNLIIQVTRMFLNIRSLKDWIQIKKRWNGIENVQSHTILIPNGNIPLGDEQMVFWLIDIS